MDKEKQLKMERISLELEKSKTEMRIMRE